MRVTSKLPINCIIVEREPIGPATLALADYLRSGGSVPPIHVERLGNGQYKICDGRHRVLAYKLLGRNEIEAHYAVIEAPQSNKQLPVTGEGHVPQGDGCSLPHGTCLED